MKFQILPININYIDSQVKSRIQNILASCIYIAGLSLPLIITLGRVLIPDYSYDTMNYHTFLGARGWVWTDYAHIEFYPTGIHNYFPLLDMINTLGRMLLGYRLGTITQLLFFYLSVWIIFLIIKNLNISINNKVIDALFKVNIFISLEALFQLGSYYIDVINSFFILLGLLTYVRFKSTNKTILLILSTIIFSLAALMKYTNYIYLVPYIILLLVEIYKQNSSIAAKIKILLIQLLIFLFINTPWMVWNYINTKNPVFPYFNSIFKSEIYELTSIKFIFGPMNILEAITYPIYILFNNTRLGEYHEIIPDYKFSFYFIILFLTYPAVRRFSRNNYKVGFLFSFFIINYICWAFTFGYARYAIALEMLAGILLIAVVSQLNKMDGSQNKSFVYLILFLFYWQNIHFIENNFRHDISWRPNYWNNRSVYIQESRNLFNSNYYYPEILEVDVYLMCSSPNLGYMVPSNLVSLPVITLPDRSSETEPQRQFRQEVIKRIPEIGNLDEIIFISIIKNEGMNPNSEACYKLLDSYGANIIDTTEIEFLGYKGIRLQIVRGSIPLSSIN